MHHQLGLIKCPRPCFFYYPCSCIISLHIYILFCGLIRIDHQKHKREKNNREAHWKSFERFIEESIQVIFLSSVFIVSLWSYWNSLFMPWGRSIKLIVNLIKSCVLFTSFFPFNCLFIRYFAFVATIIKLVRWSFPYHLISLNSLPCKPSWLIILVRHISFVGSFILPTE